MDVAYINCFINSTTNLFHTMIKVPVALGKPSLKRHEDRLFKLYKYSAVIDLTGGIEGRVVVNFSQPVATALVSALLAKTVTAEEELLDALGEIANMVAGGAKSSMPCTAAVGISTPLVMPTHQVGYPERIPIILIPFDTSAGRFVIEMALRYAANTPPEDGAGSSPTVHPPHHKAA